MRTNATNQISQIVGPHLDALWRLFREIGRVAPKVAEPALHRD